MIKLVRGIGINDADYKVQIKEELPSDGLKRKRGVIWLCPYYQRWSNMLRRCYCTTELNRKPTYKGCSVCKEWLTFSNFKRWMEQQDWEGKQLDKDLLVYQNKVYSPETCCFVDEKVNCFLVSPIKTGIPIGVQVRNNVCDVKYAARIGHKGEYLGRFSTPHEAHRAWQKAKYQQAFELAEQQTDPRVKQGLLRVVNKIKDDHDNNIETKDF